MSGTPRRLDVLRKQVEGLNREEMELFDGKGVYMRHIKIYSLDDIDEKKIVK